MPINLSIEDLPDDLAEWLHRRAKRHHRSPEGELLAILESVEQIDREGTITIDELWERGKARGLRTRNESTQMIREDRDSR